LFFRTLADPLFSLLSELPTFTIDFVISSSGLPVSSIALSSRNHRLTSVVVFCFLLG
jgi:hypothetical protein